MTNSKVVAAVYICSLVISELSSLSVFGKPIQQESQPKLKVMFLNQKNVPGRIPRMTTKKSHQFPLSPAGMIPNIIHVNSMSHRKFVDNKRPQYEKMRSNGPQSSSLPLCINEETLNTNYRKIGTRVNTLFSSHNWGTK